MKIFKKTIALVIVLLMNVVLTCTQINSFASTDLNIKYRKIANVAVLLYNFADPFTLQIKQSLEDLEKENKDKVKFAFYDGKNNIALQTEELDLILQNAPDLIIDNLVDIDEPIVEDVINRVKVKNIPLILIDIPSQIVSKVSKYYDKVAFLSPNSKVAGIIQGKILVDLWNANKNALDKNNDNILQYVLLQGEPDSPTTIERSKYSISTINNSGIKTQQLASVSSDWSKDLAKSAIESIFLKYDGKIEAIISNNDAMAIGAIEALQKYGYNKGDTTPNIAVVGVDALPDSKNLINTGIMTGTVVQNPRTLAETYYNVGMNLVNNLNPTENTNYKIVDKEIIIPFFYEEYVKK